jgi:hypothetical protein
MGAGAVLGDLVRQLHKVALPVRIFLKVEKSLWNSKKCPGKAMNDLKK